MHAPVRKTIDLSNLASRRVLIFDIHFLVDDFNAKIKVAVLQERQGWVPPQIKDLKLVIPEHYTFMGSNIFFIVLGIPDQPPPLDHTKHLLIHHLLQNHYHCTVKKSTKLKTSWIVNHQVC